MINYKDFDNDLNDEDIEEMIDKKSKRICKENPTYEKEIIKRGRKPPLFYIF